MTAEIVNYVFSKLVCHLSILTTLFHGIRTPDGRTDGRTGGHTHTWSPIAVIPCSGDCGVHHFIHGNLELQSMGPKHS